MLEIQFFFSTTFYPSDDKYIYPEPGVPDEDVDFPVTANAAPTNEYQNGTYTCDALFIVCCSACTIHNTCTFRRFFKHLFVKGN